MQYPDLVFTIETPEGFPLCCLPTLDFLLWLEWWGLNHTYLEKEMKTPFLIMQRSAMGEHQKASILSNELVRRLSNINVGLVAMSEVIKVVEQFIQQLKNSGYSHKQSREFVICGIKGWKNKIKRREKERKGFYREGKTALKSRVSKKLLEKENWYRQERGKDLEDEEEKDKKEKGFKGKGKGKGGKKDLGEKDTL
jgi:hypothetical protein